MQLIRAIISQLLALGFAMLLLRISPLHGAWKFALLQGLAAALISRLLQQQRWWQGIHLCFLPAVLGMLALNLPPWIYLAALIIMALLFWGTVKGDVPLFLSSSAVAEALAEIAARENAASFAELGAGIGSVVVPLARLRPAIHVDAWELAPLPWAILKHRCSKIRNVTVHRESLWKCDIKRFDVVFAFLSPIPMPQLGTMVSDDMPPGSLFVSSSFPIPNWEPEEIRTLADARKTRLYCYRIKPR